MGALNRNSWYGEVSTISYQVANNDIRVGCATQLNLPITLARSASVHDFKELEGKYFLTRKECSRSLCKLVLERRTLYILNDPINQVGNGS